MGSIDGTARTHRDREDYARAALLVKGEAAALRDKQLG